MAIIYSYPKLTTLVGSDLLLVSDMSTPNKDTKNVTVQQIVDLIPSIVPGGGTVTSVGFSTGTTGLTVSSSTLNPIDTSGTFTLAGTLSQASGGTGLTTYSSGDILYADASSNLIKLPIGAAGEVLSISGVPALPYWATASTGTVTSVELSVASGMGLTWTAITGGNPINSANPAGNLQLGGTLALANGGTGAVTANAALTNLLPSQTSNSGKFLTTNGSTTSWATVVAGVSTISFASTGLTPSSALGGDIIVGGQLSKTNGGTGLTSYSDGDILYGASTGTALNKLSMSSTDTGKVLTVNASGNGVQWSNPTSGVGGSGTAGYAARWTSTSTLAASGALRDDGTYVAINAVPGLGNTEFIVVTPTANTTSTTGIYYYQNNNTASIGMKSVVGDYYTGSSDIVGVQGVASGLSTTGLRYGVQGISVVPSSGTNIGIYGWTQNTGSGNSYAARFKDGNEAIGKVWVCQTSQGDGAWASSPGGGLYAIDVPTQSGTYGTIDLQKDGAVSTSVQIHPNDSTLNNSDLQVVSNQGGTDRIAVAHKDLFTGTPGTYLGVNSLAITSSGHITAATSEKFVGRQSKGISRELASFRGASGAQVFAMPMLSEGEGKFGDLSLELTNAGTGGATINIAWYTGLLGSGLSASNLLVTYGSKNVANLLTPASITVPVPDSNYQASPQDKFLNGGNYIMIISIPAQVRLQSISQDGDIINGGCLVTGWTTAQATLNGVTSTARVAGSPLLLPANQWKSVGA